MKPQVWRARVGFPSGHDQAKAYALGFARTMLGPDCGFTVDEAEAFGTAYAPLQERAPIRPVKIRRG